MPTLITHPSATQFREMILVVGSRSSAIFSPSRVLNRTKMDQWTSLSCLYKLRLLCGQGDNIFAFGTISFFFFQN